MTSATNIPVHVKKNRTAGDWAILILLIVGGLVMLFPFIVLLLNAFKTTADYNSSGPLSWPKEFSTVGLMKFWNRVNYPEKLWNSIWTSGLVAILAVVLSMFNAFALGIGRVKGRRWIVLLIMLANMLPQEAMLYPLYIISRRSACTIRHGQSSSSSPSSRVLSVPISCHRYTAHSRNPYWKRRLSTAQVVGPSSVR